MTECGGVCEDDGGRCGLELILAHKDAPTVGDIASDLIRNVQADGIPQLRKRRSIAGMIIILFYYLFLLVYYIEIHINCIIYINY